ncbi:hypothetical protein PDQ75_25070 [Bacillus cereus group sp. Bc015]|uniref:hypothetical protein n=1 Tax=Bacillus cereus group sp. Bc015 TaxID=3018123 RepID=UPI0022E371B9|nr:hypothetical protein [Bacillus cereus group sp. Bc015]MDA2738429.1 hypothetical protein [Bacillus cereus group sp. Bc015]
MRYDNQRLYDMGFENLAYQLEAMMDKAPELEDDFNNLVTIITDELDGVNEIAERNYDQGYEMGHNEGYSEGYSDAEWEYESQYDNGYEDGRSDGYDEGFDNGYEAGLEEGQSQL